MDVSPENSRRLANLSFVCVCCVVFVHVPWSVGGAGVRNLLATVAVQYFFVVSGFFLAARFGEPGWWRIAVSRRIRSLIVPYVLWMAITAALMWVLTGERPIGFGNSGVDLRKMPLLVPLWFVRALFLFVVSSPLIRLSLERWGRLFLLLEFLAAGAVSVMLTRGGWTVDGGWGGLLVYGFPLEGLFYFSVGIWLRTHPLSSAWHQRRWPCLAVSLAAVALRVVFEAAHAPVAFGLDLVTVPFCLVALWHAMPAADWPKALVKGSFAIYIMHAVVLGVLWTVPGLRDRCPPWFAAAGAILVSLAVSTVLKRAAPGVARILFGGR